MPPDKQKVLFFPAWYPSRVDGLAGIFTQRHAEVLTSLYQVNVLYVCAQEGLGKQFDFQLTQENDVRVLRVYFKKSTGKKGASVLMNGLRFGVAAILGYMRAEKEFGRADINHVHVLTRTAVLPMILGWLLKVPYVITEHWSRYLPEDNTYGGFIRKRITNMCVKYSKGLSGVSNALISSMRKHGLSHANTLRISNVVDTELFRPLAVEKLPGPCFIHVSSFDPASKNVKGIIDAVSLADREGLKLTVYLIGDGEEKDRLQQYASKQRFQNVKVIFTGKLMGPDLVPYFSLADAFILFSNYENQPCVVLESFSCGLPVIGTKAGGVPELITPGSGFLVEPGNFQELKEAIKRFIGNMPYLNGAALRKKAIENYSPDAVRAQFKSLYTTALES